MRSSGNKSFAFSDWNSRISKAKSEKAAAENTTYGVKISTLLCDFFVSEAVIPQQCKNIENGTLKSFNLSSVDRYELIMKEVFRKKHAEDKEEAGDISTIKKAMYALLNILNYPIKENSRPDTTIHQDALLGAVAFLFSALDEHSLFHDVLNSMYKKKFRNMVYHYWRVSKMSPQVAAHFYEHCRSELAGVYTFPELNNKIDEKDKFGKGFIYSLIFCLDLCGVMYEWKDSVIKELDEHKSILDKVIKHFNEHPNEHSVGSYPKATALAIRGNVIGLYVARLSSGAMSVLKQRTFDTDATDEIVMATPTAEEKITIERKFTKYIKAGNDFRHVGIDYSSLPQIFNVKIEVPDLSPNDANKSVVVTSDIAINTAVSQDAMPKDNSALNLQELSFFNNTVIARVKIVGAKNGGSKKFHNH